MTIRELTKLMMLTPELMGRGIKMDKQPEDRHISITEFLTPIQIREVMQLKTARLICDKIIRPNLEEINRKLGRRNDPMYLACLVENILNQLPPL